MSKFPSFSAIPVLAGLLCSLADPTTANGTDRALLKGLPMDVLMLADRELECRRWLTTEVTNEISDNTIAQAMNRLRCESIASDIERLRLKYSRSPQTLRVLDAADDSDL